jgi:hypothetical protein
MDARESGMAMSMAIHGVKAWYASLRKQSPRLLDIIKLEVFYFRSFLGSVLGAQRH